METVHRHYQIWKLGLKTSITKQPLYKLIIYDHRLFSWPGINANQTRYAAKTERRELHNDTRDTGKSASIICVLINASVIQRECEWIEGTNQIKDLKIEVKDKLGEPQKEPQATRTTVKVKIQIKIKTKVRLLHE